MAVQLADRVGRSGRPYRERGHVELHAAAVVVRTEREKAIAVGAERAPAAGEMLFDEVKRERVVSRRDRRVRGEDRRLADLLERVVERRALRDQIVNALEDDEARVSFVQVVDGQNRRLVQTAVNVASWNLKTAK